MNGRFREAAASPAVLLLFVLLLFAFLAVVLKPEQAYSPVVDSEWASMRPCVADALQRAMTDKVQFEAMHAAIDLCYKHLHSQGLLNDFKLRRLKFTQQSYDQHILLWMVVVITVSGVVLAGLQLLASFKLASSHVGRPAGVGEDWVASSAIALEQGKLSVKSSVTGLLILICSFAFFWVFVYEIFVIKIVDVDRGSAPEGRKSSTSQIDSGLLIPREPKSATGATNPSSAVAK